MEFIKWSKKFLYQLSIQTKLVCIFMLTSLIAFGVTMYMHRNINHALTVIDNVYTSNAQLNEVSNALSGIQLSMRGYLDTKSSDSLNQYYMYEQRYKTLLAHLNNNVKDSDSAIMEKNIRGISETYQKLASEAVDAKRASNINKYKVSYDEAYRMFNYLNSYLFSLNNEQFKDNSASYVSLASSLQLLEQITTLVNVGVALFNILLIILLTRQITHPLMTLSGAANSVAEGDFEIPKLKVYSMDEVGIVTKTFNKMVVNLKEYIIKVKESMEAENEAKERELLMKTHLKDAQLKYYQAQIHPHFLFNTLNAGAQLAMLENAEKTYSFVQKMSEFFRYSMNTLNKDVCLEEEIELVENYLYIMNVRFAGEINFEKKIACDIEGVSVPGVILQPLVENSLQYGIRDISWDGNIILTVDKIEKGYKVCVIDNGRGIPPERLEEIMSGQLLPEDKQELSNGVGIGNVKERLELFYKTKNLLKIESSGENKGTCVTISIPQQGEINAKGSNADV